MRCSHLQNKEYLRGFAAREQANSSRDPGSRFKRVVLISLMLLVTAVVPPLIVLKLNFGSLSAASRYLQGEHLTVDASEKSFGKTVAGQTRDVTFLLTNQGRVPFRIVGCRTTCVCTAPKNLPMRIEPGETKPLLFTVHTARMKGDASVRVTLFTGLATQRHVELLITGEVDG